jgi:transcriptional regulator with XRE-family HTH domain
MPLIGNHACVPKRIGADKARTTHTLAESLGAEITRLRVAKGWSQVKFADLLGYDERYIRQLEQATKSPTLRTLINVAEAFSISVSSLIKRAERRISARK